MKKAAKQIDAQQGERFLRVVAHPNDPKDLWKAYQIEEIIAQGNKIVSRRFIGKKDTKQQILGEMEILVVPDA